MTVVRCLTHDVNHYGPARGHRLVCVQPGCLVPPGCRLMDEIEVLPDRAEITCEACLAWLGLGPLSDP